MTGQFTIRGNLTRVFVFQKGSSLLNSRRISDVSPFRTEARAPLRYPEKALPGLGERYGKKLKESGRKNAETSKKTKAIYANLSKQTLQKVQNTPFEEKIEETGIEFAREIGSQAREASYESVFLDR